MHKGRDKDSTVTPEHNFFIKDNDNTPLLEINHRKNTISLAIGGDIGVSGLLKVVKQRGAARIAGNI